MGGGNGSPGYGMPLEEDVELKLMWETLQKKTVGEEMNIPYLVEEMYNGGVVTRKNLQLVLTHFVFTVSVYHELVGGVVEYSSDPTILCLKIRQGREICDPQTFLQTLAIVSGTGMKLPSFMHDATPWGAFKHTSDWSFLFEKRMKMTCKSYDQKRQNNSCKGGHFFSKKYVKIRGKDNQGGKHWEKLQERLIAQAHKVDERNKKREAVDHSRRFLRFHPAFMETSVSV